MKKDSRKKLILLLLLAGGGYYAYKKVPAFSAVFTKTQESFKSRNVNVGQQPVNTPISKERVYYGGTGRTSR